MLKIFTEYGPIEIVCTIDQVDKELSNYDVSMYNITGFTYEQFNEEEIRLGDKYINIMSPERGVRIANEETLKRIVFAKSINYGTCYYKRVEE